MELQEVGTDRRDCHVLFESQFLKLGSGMKQAEKYSGGGLQMAEKEEKKLFSMLLKLQM